MISRLSGWAYSLFKPLPLSIGIIGYGSSLAVKEYAYFAPYAASWYWLLILSGVCHTLLALYDSGQKKNQRIENPFLKELIHLRGKIASRIEKLPTESMRTEILELINQMDNEIIPRLKALALKHQQLGEELLTYKDSKRGLIKPSQHVINDLQRIFEKQEEVMRGTLQEVADINATISGFIQEGDDKQMVLSMTEWKENLGTRWKVMQELLEQVDPHLKP